MRQRDQLPPLYIIIKYEKTQQSSNLYGGPVERNTGGTSIRVTSRTKTCLHPEMNATYAADGMETMMAGINSAMETADSFVYSIPFGDHAAGRSFLQLCLS